MKRRLGAHRLRGSGWLWASLIGVSPTAAMAQARGPSAVIIVTELLLFALFFAALWVVYRIWMTVIDVLANKPSTVADAIAKAFGKTEASLGTKRFRLRAIGTGLGSSIVILAIAVAAMYVLNDQVVVP